MDYQNVPMKKYVYVKQHVMESIKNGQSKVHINPNFMKPPVVHVNPHFKANLTIHVNPNILKPPVENKPKAVVEKLHEKASQQQAVNRLINVPLKTQVKNKYKIVNNVTAQKHPFKIDNRTSKTPSKKLKRLVDTYTKNVYVKCNKKTSPSANIPNRKRLSNNKISVKKATRLLTIRGEKYTIGTNNRTMTLLSNISRKSTNTPISLKHNRYVKSNEGKHILLSQAKQKSITILKNKLKKSNMPCPFYRKFGKCKGKENGTCIRIHNADQVSLCPKFLQGACINKACLLSHKVSPEKMPTCWFYLEGLCSKDDCPYLHVKINAKAEICIDFLEGFCKKAAECDKRHQYLCPDFEQKGSCRRRKCQYPHKTVVRDKVVKNIPPKLQTQIKKIPVLNPPLNNKEVLEKLLTIRYYDETLPKNTEISTKMDESYKLNAESCKCNSIEKPIKTRPTLGELPSFIPFS